MIRPTIGRILWYFPDNDAEKQAAIITYVKSDRMVNLCVFSGNGHSAPSQNVQLVQPEDEKPNGSYCEWMPYQIKKASGSESGEKAAGAQSI